MLEKIPLLESINSFKIYNIIDILKLTGSTNLVELMDLMYQAKIGNIDEALALVKDTGSQTLQESNKSQIIFYILCRAGAAEYREGMI